MQSSLSGTSFGFQEDSILGVALALDGLPEWLDGIG
jgi:hypothetical protein